MRYRAWLLAASVLVAAAAASDAAAQTIADRVNAVRDGNVEMHFAPRPGVCGDGRGSVWIQSADRGYRSDGFVCVVGPVRVTLSRAGGETVTIRKCIACRPSRVAPGDVDLGEVPPAEAAKYLLEIAHKSGSRNADEAVSAAAFADATNLTADFVRLIRDDDAMLEARKQALFWLGQSDGPTGELVRLYDELKPYDLREHYTFVISQCHDDDAALSKLLDIARRDPDTRVRKQAMFWLGQSRDPRALKFFKDVLSP